MFFASIIVGVASLPITAASQQVPAHEVVLSTADELSRVTSAALVGRHLYVAQPHEAAVRVYTVTEGEARYLGTLGRRGEGPGEFDFPLLVGEGSEGSVWVADPGLGRVSWFHGFEVEATLPAGPARTVFPLSTDEIFTWGSLGQPGAARIMSPKAGDVLVGNFLVDGDLVIDLGAVTRASWQPYAPTPLFAGLHGDLWIFENGNPLHPGDSLRSFDIRLASGETVRGPRIPIPPAPLVRRDRETEIERWVSEIEDYEDRREINLGSRPDLVRAVEKAIFWPEYLPYGEDLLVGCGNLLLVRRLDRGRREWVRISRQGVRRRLVVPHDWTAVGSSCRGVLATRPTDWDVPELLLVGW